MLYLLRVLFVVFFVSYQPSYGMSPYGPSDDALWLLGKAVEGFGALMSRFIGHPVPEDDDDDSYVPPTLGFTHATGSASAAKKGGRRVRFADESFDDCDFFEQDHRSLKQLNADGATNTWECGFFAVFHAGLCLSPAGKGLPFDQATYKRYLEIIFRRDNERLARFSITSLRPLKSFYFPGHVDVHSTNLMHTGDITRFAALSMLGEEVLNDLYADAATDGIAMGAPRVINAMRLRLLEVRPRLVIADAEEFFALRDLVLAGEPADGYSELVARLRGTPEAPPVIIWGTGNHWIVVSPDFATRKLRLFDSYPHIIPSVRLSLRLLNEIIFR